MDLNCGEQTRWTNLGVKQGQVKKKKIRCVYGKWIKGEKVNERALEEKEDALCVVPQQLSLGHAGTRGQAG